MLLGNRKLLDPYKNEQYTPKWLFDRMGTRFDLDVAAPTGGAANVPASRYYTKEDDGLSQPWTGFVFMNPPYSEAKIWVDKFISHGHGIALLPFSKANWMVDLWTKSSGICLVNKIKFERPDSTENEIFMPVALFGMGELARKILLDSEINRVR